MKKTFYDYVNKTDGCWLWVGPLNKDGYGYWRDKLVHRITYLEYHGAYPPNTVTDHLCKVRHCVNPEHLEAVSIAENVRRGRASEATKLRHASVTHCPNGHEYTEDNTYRSVGKDGAPRRHCKACVKTRRKASYYSNRAL